MCIRDRSGIVQKYNCTLKRLDFQQEDGFLSSLSLGHNGIEIKMCIRDSIMAGIYEVLADRAGKEE